MKILFAICLAAVAILAASKSLKFTQERAEKLNRRQYLCAKSAQEIITIRRNCTAKNP